MKQRMAALNPGANPHSQEQSPRNDFAGKHGNTPGRLLRARGKKGGARSTKTDPWGKPVAPHSGIRPGCTQAPGQEKCDVKDFENMQLL